MKSPDLFRLDGRVALVTGGAGIYGRHIVQALAEAGAQVVIASRDEEHCRGFASELTACGLAASGDRCDLGNEAEIRDLRDRILARHGRLDVLFNNALARARGNLHQMSGAEWEASMHVNSTGLFLACKIFSEPMQEQRSGSIVNIASIYGMGGPDATIYEGTNMVNPIDYAFTKGGMINLTRYLASFLGPYNIRVNCISPGGFEQPDMAPSFVKNYSRKTLLGRMAEADDIKGPAVFLASEASRYVTGQNVPVDGGWTAI